MFSGQVPLWMFYAALAYFVGFMFVVGSLFLWHIWRRKERPPEKFKLLRGPGETLRRRVQKADDDLVLYVLVGAFGPLLFGGGALILAGRLPKGLILGGAVVALAVFLSTLLLAGLLLFRFFH